MGGQATRLGLMRAGHHPTKPLTYGCAPTLVDLVAIRDYWREATSGFDPAPPPVVEGGLHAAFGVQLAADAFALLEA